MRFLSLLALSGAVLYDGINVVQASLRGQLIEALHEAGCQKALYSLEKGVECLQPYFINAGLASDHAIALASVVAEFYVFASGYRDPRNSNESNPFNIPVIDFKVDVVSEYRKISENYAKLPRTEKVNLFEFVASLNEVEIQLYDAHVSFAGNSPIFNFGKSSVVLMKCGKIVQGSGSCNAFSLRNVRNVDGKPSFSVDGKVLSSIDGLEPMEWAKEIVTSGIFSIPYQGVGSRINNFLASSLSFKVGTSGDIRKLKDTYELQFEDGSIETARWVLNFMEESGYDRTRTCGPAFRAWDSALASIENRNLFCPRVPNDSEKTREEPSLLQVSREPFTDEDGWFHVYDPLQGMDFELKVKCFDTYCVFHSEVVGSPKNFRTAWNALLTMASEKGITKLIFDCNENGGGNVYTVYMMIKAIFPDITFEEGCQKVDQPFGRTAEYFVERNWFIQDQSLSALLGNKTQLEEQAKNIMRDQCSAFETILDLANAAQIFVKNIEDGGEWSRQEFELENEYNKLIRDFPLDELKAAKEACERGELTAELIETTIRSLPAFNPLVHGANENENPFLHPRQVFRGGEWTKFTAKFYPDSCSGLKEEMPQHPFTNILMVSSGTTGSSGDSLVTTPTMISKANPARIPRVERLVWGGTGEDPAVQQLTPTSFQGGTNGNGDRVSQLWLWLALAEVAKELTGSEILQDLDNIPLPVIPPGNFKMPQFSKMERYQTSMGEQSLPSQFYLMTPEYYIPDWFFQTEWGTDDASSTYKVFADQIA